MEKLEYLDKHKNKSHKICAEHMFSLSDLFLWKVLMSHIINSLSDAYMKVADREYKYI